MNLWRLFIIPFLSFLIVPASAQKKLQSRVITADSLPIQAVITYQKTDSSVVTKMITDSAGYFSYPHLKDGRYLLKAEALGYTETYSSFAVNAGKYNLPKAIMLVQSMNDLQSVVVSSKRPAVVVKKDTVEYSASVVKLGADATTEDIFQKIPGLEVSKNGSIKANGEPVTQIYVDGKPFFGTDIKAVTQNFPADMIEKIQVINKKPEGAIDDGSYEKIINIILKRNRKQGWFGNNTAGVGTANRYEVKSGTNYLHYDTKLSLIGGATNTGSANGTPDINSPGDSRNSNLKISFATKAGRKIDLSTWAAFDASRNNIAQNIYRTNVFSDSSNIYTERNNSSNSSRNLNAGLYLEYKLDSFTLIKVNQHTGFAKNNFSNGASSQTKTGEYGYSINDGLSSASGNNAHAWLNGNINYNRKLGSNGRNLNVDFTNRVNGGEALIYNKYNNTYYTDSTYETLQNRFNSSNSRNKNFVASTSYYEPLTTKSTLAFSYAWNHSNSDLPKEIFEYDPVTGLYDSILPAFSTHFNNTSNSGTASVTYNYHTRKSGFAVGLRWKDANINSNAFNKDSAYRQNFSGLLPNMGFYKTGKKFSLNLDYNMYIKAPDAMQLQPVIDNNDPLYVRLGNPDLKYTVVQTLQYKCNWFNSKKETGINARASFSLLADNISNSLVYDEATGKQTTSPINTNGAYNWNAWCTFYKPFFIGDDKIKWNINLSGAGYSNNNLLNGAANVTSYNMMKILTGFVYDTPEWLDLRTNFSFTRQTNQYSLQSNLNVASDYITINPVITIRPTETTEINLDYDFRSLSNDNGSASNDVNLLNANIKQYVNDKKAIAISLKAFDLLNENNNSMRTFGDNYVQDLNFNSLTRFLLLSVSFRLQHFN